MDDFAYFFVQPEKAPPHEKAMGWELQPCIEEDLVELSYFYEHRSGGLMIPALDLEAGLGVTDELDQEFAKLKLKRRRLRLSLKHQGELKAIILVNLSDVGLNMSELTNCIQIIVLDSDGLDKENLLAALAELGKAHFENDKVPVILYPVKYAEDQEINYDKVYSMWILNCQNLDQYFKFCNTFLARI